MEDSATFHCGSFVRGYIICLHNIWEPVVGECLKHRKEPTNEMDKTTVDPEKVINWLKNKRNKTEEKVKENVKHL